MTEALPTKLEQYFSDYQSQHLSLGTLSVFNQELFRQEFLSYFDLWWSDNVKIDSLFSRFFPIWRIWYHSGAFSKASECWDFPINLAHEWEAQHDKKFLHKGTPYYCKGMSLLQAGNIDTSFLFFHQAVEEDRKWPSNDTRQTPAWLFVSLNVFNTRHLTRNIVTDATDWLERYMVEYRLNRGGFLIFEKLHTNVLAPHISDETTQRLFDETTFSFTHSVFRIRQLLALSPRTRDSQFAAQIELDILFNMARIAEVWLKQKQRLQSDKLARHLEAFFTAKGWGKPELGTINASNFDAILTELLDGSQQLLKRGYSETESDLLILYALRNKAGHAPTASNAVRNHFPELIERALFGLFTIAEKLFVTNS